MIELKEELIKESFKKFEFCTCTNILKEKFKLDNHKKLKEPSESALKLVVQLTTDIQKLTVESNANDNNLITLLKQCFQSLRNAASYSCHTQNFLIKNTEILINAKYFMSHLLNVSNDIDNACIKMILQFLINVGINNPEVQVEIWNQVSEIMLKLINHTSLSFLSAALTANIISKNVSLIPTEQCFIEDILTAYKMQHDDLLYHNQIVEVLVINNHVTHCYEQIDVDSRITLLEVLKNILMFVEEQLDIPNEFIELLSQQFKRKSDCILKTVTNYLDQIEPREVALLLECLSSLSSKSKYQKTLQDDKSLLINCIFLLRSIHSLGKVDLNHFSSIDKISELSLVDGKVEEHPSFGFKANLIRILGNLAWKHQENQNELRELECIPLLLDCCKIDGRNPLIIQWSILTIRNVMENNASNQQVVKEMQLQGVVNSGTLQEMGITLHTDGDSKIGIVSLDSIQE